MTKKRAWRGEWLPLEIRNVFPVRGRGLSASLLGRPARGNVKHGFRPDIIKRATIELLPTAPGEGGEKTRPRVQGPWDVRRNVDQSLENKARSRASGGTRSRSGTDLERGGKKRAARSP